MIESKRNAIHPYIAKQQALPDAQAIGAPFIFLSKGELIYFWDYENDDARIVASFFSRRDLERLLTMRASREALATIEIPEFYIRQGETRRVRPYQQEAMRALDHTSELGKRRFLMELPTGTGKTDVVCLYLKRLFEAGWAERVLVLVDREQLAKQALEAIQDILGQYSTYWLRSGMARQERQITVALLQTLIGRVEDYTAEYFDVVVADDSRRSFMRIVALGSIFQVRPSYFDEQAVYHLGKIGNNLSQLAKVANSIGLLVEARLVQEVLQDLLPLFGCGSNSISALSPLGPVTGLAVGSTPA